MRIKKPLELFSLWQYFGPTIRKSIRLWPGDPPVASSEIVALMLAAVHPKTMNMAAVQKHFGTLYGRLPDFVLSLLPKLRKEWSADSHRAIVRRFCAVNMRAGRKIITLATDDEIATAIHKQGGPIITTATVKSARRSLQPMPELLIHRDISEAIKALRAKGYVGT